MVRAKNQRNPGPKAERISRVYDLAAKQGMSYREIAKELGVSAATVSRAMKIAIETIPEEERAVTRRVVAERIRLMWQRAWTDLDNGHPPTKMLPILLQINAQAARFFGLNEELPPAPININVAGVDEGVLAEAVEVARAQEEEILNRKRGV